jgi:cupin 2 domain-containing protein
LEVRQVLSGELEAPVDYLQPDDEWALVVSGSARLEVDDDVLELGPGDWVWLPAGTPHRLLRTEQGTSWVTVHHRQ